MYKIFIDTNIILNFYRINNKDSMNEILKELAYLASFSYFLTYTFKLLILYIL